MRSFVDAAVFTLAGVLISLTVPSLAAAQTCERKEFQLVGFSSSSGKGHRGVFQMTQDCQQDFEASRVCTSEEVMNTVNIPVLPNNNAWVRPTIKPVASGVASLLADASGSDSSDGSSGSLPGDLTCRGWSTDSGYNGLTVSNVGGFRPRSCGSNRPVACCALIPVPEPSLAAVQGGAVAALASLSGLQKVRARKPAPEPGLSCES